MLQNYLNSLSPWRQYFIDVSVALVAFVGGNALLALTGCGGWATAIGMIPFGWWLWYRGVMPNAAVYPLLGLVGVYTVVWRVQEIWWPNPPDFFMWINILIAYTFVLLIRRRIATSEVPSNS